MNLLYNAALRKRLSESNYSFCPTHENTLFPRFLLYRLLEVTRDDNGKITAYKKGYSKECFKLISYILAMKSTVKIGGQAIAFVPSDSKSELAGLCNISSRNGQCIIDRLIQDKILANYTLNKHNGFIICDYNDAFVNGKTNFFTIPHYVFESDEHNINNFWQMSKAAIKLYFSFMSEIQAHKAVSHCGAKTKKQADIKKIIHYNNYNIQKKILDELKDYMDIVETQENYEVVWIININHVSPDREIKQNEISKNYKSIAEKMERDNVLHIFEEVMIDYQIFDLFSHTEKELDSYVNIYNNFGETIFKKAFTILLNDKSKIKTSHIQKLWGICNTLQKAENNKHF